MNPEYILIAIFGLALGVSVHESAHAWMAHKCGDSTAYDEGRVSLNPIDHIDPVGTILLPAILIISGSPFLFGWAKPVMINPRNFKNPLVDERWVAAAGPVSNMIIAVLFAVILKILLNFSILTSLSYDTGKTLVNLLVYTLQINVILAVFNMIPVDPLDGSKIMRSYLSYENMRKYDIFNAQWGMMLIIILIVTNVLSLILRFVASPIINFLLGSWF